MVDIVEPEYKKAIDFAMRQPRLWTAGLLVALTLTATWDIVAGWGPEYVGERTETWLGPYHSDIRSTAVFLAAALAVFIAFKAFNYLGELVLVRQVEEGLHHAVPSFGVAFGESRGGYLDFALTLIPWDAMKVILIYIPAITIVLWDRWDPDYNLWALYVLVILGWFVILVLALFLAGVTAMLAARSSLLEEKNPYQAWLRGWALFSGNISKCFLYFLQALAADIIFLVVAFPAAALVPWLLDLVAEPIGLTPLRWLIYLIGYALLIAGLLALQTLVQCYKSSLWTVVYEELAMELRAGEVAAALPPPGHLIEPPPEFMPPDGDGAT
jgi:hypothetical protein